MKASIISTALALLAASAHAAPTPAQAEARQFQAQITFTGNDPNVSFTMSVPTAPGSSFAITNPLSVSKISSAGGASCMFVGADGSETTVIGAQTAAVGPPQPQVLGACSAL